MKTELEQILPEKIEERSFEIISEELNALFPEKTFLPGEELILKRVIHTTADFDYAENLIFSEGAVEQALEALKSGAVIITDTNMGKAGINKKSLERLEGEVLCFMADSDVAEKARLYFHCSFPFPHRWAGTVLSLLEMRRLPWSGCLS